ncbi:hypothetical protein [Bacillus sp. B-jedd]|uniref:hypothetical protein n=1 Tax=Bacillus sp. B-jedd TaxID=1476857 RepID=UPI000515671D|nr:hypothetical protein [Bacillus sp. B-jedd]CEG27572.1 group-specific protein [Bacillus sp. B-jedd]
MFDPTAFDNMKVIIEGAFYDLDEAGKLMIMDRKDIMDLATLSRQFSISFYLPECPGIEAELRLMASLENLASELLQGSTPDVKPGCELILFFRAVHRDSFAIYEGIQEYTESKWGPERNILQTACWNPLTGHETVMNEIAVDFNRIVTEAQLEELKEIPDYMVESMIGLYSLLGETWNE